MNTTDDSSRPILGSVVIPCLSGDLPELDRIFTLWSRQAFRPNRNAPPPTLLIVFNNADDDTLDQAKEFFVSHSELSKSFSGVQAMSADLTGDADLYVRKEPRLMGRFGNKAGPNFLFQKAMHFAAHFGDYTLQIELDCLPVGPGWIDQTLDVIERNRGGWVIGSPYLGKMDLDPRVQFHLNGNALYKAGDPQFLTFLDDVWIARILEHAPTYPHLAYDCWWAFEMSHADASSRNISWQLWQRYDSFFRNDPFIVNLRVAFDDIAEFFKVHDERATLSAPPIFFHGRAIQDLIRMLCAEPEQELRPFIESLPELKKEPSVADSRKIHDGLAAPKVGQLPPQDRTTTLVLSKGFDRIEGPGQFFDRTRFVRMSEPQCEVIPTQVADKMTLHFRIDARIAGAGNGIPDFILSQNGVPIEHRKAVDEKSKTGTLEIDGGAFELGQPVSIAYEAVISGETGDSDRGLVLFETDLIFELPGSDAPVINPEAPALLASSTGKGAE